MKVEAVRRSLEAKQKTLRKRVATIEAELRTPGSQDSGERAVEVENHEVLEHLDQAERLELDEIEVALHRIANGTYTTCSECGGRIPDARLDALPYATACVRCAGDAT